jgi:hypothetical protein
VRFTASAIARKHLAFGRSGTRDTNSLMRSLVVAGSLALSFIIACGGSTGGNGPDAGVDGNGSGSGSGSGNLLCKNKATPPGTGHHNPGQDCMNSCHFHGFSLAGTMYSSSSGGAAVAGATITVKDARGQTFDMVTMTNGNFYTLTPVTFPVTIVASECQLSPNPVPMTAALQSADAGCNKGGCHVSGAQGRIHLP